MNKVTNATTEFVKRAIMYRPMFLSLFYMWLIRGVSALEDIPKLELFRKKTHEVVVRIEIDEVDSKIQKLK